MEKKTILSFDVGIKNLAYCLLEKDVDNFKILKWGIINLVEDQKKCVFCMKGGKQCDKVAKFNITHKDGIHIFKKNMENTRENSEKVGISIPKRPHMTFLGGSFLGGPNCPLRFSHWSHNATHPWVPRFHASRSRFWFCLNANFAH